MSTLVKVASSSSHIYGRNATYATARTTSSAIHIIPLLGQAIDEGLYNLLRLFLNFDTSSIDPDAVISTATLTLTPANIYNDTNFDIDVVAQDWSAQDPLSAGNRETAYDNCLAAATSSIWANSADLVLDTPKATAIATGIVAKGATTYISLRSAKDKAGTTPTGYEFLELHPFDHATASYRPTLTVTYTVPPTGQTFVRSPMWGHF